MTWTGFKQRSQLEKWLAQKGIKYDHAKGDKIVTTQASVDAAFATNGGGWDEFEKAS